MVKRRKPSHRAVNEDTDLLDLIPGDRVNVIYGTQEFMTVYKNVEMDDGELSSSSKVFFVKIPEDHETGHLKLYKSYIRFLQYVDGKVHFDIRHIHMDPIEKIFPKYEELKGLIALVTE